jgi:hypothetical protein
MALVIYLLQLYLVALRGKQLKLLDLQQLLNKVIFVTQLHQLLQRHYQHQQQ